MHVTRDRNKLIIHNANNKDKKNLIKIGCVYNAVSMTWSVTFNKFKLKQLENIGCSIPDYIRQGLTKKQLRTTILRTIQLPSYITDGLFDYQVQGVKMLFAGYSLLADEMGLGKTITLLRFLQGSVRRRAVVVCPAFLKEKWAYEVKKWTTHEPFVIYGQSKVKLPKRGVYIINYDILAYHIDTLMQHSIELVASDEAHLCGNDATIRTKSLRRLATHSTRYVPMTGTPILNNAKELYPHLNILASDEFYSKKLFLAEYCIEKNDRIVGTKNHEKLHRVLKDSIMIRRTYDEVKKDFGSSYNVRIDDQLIPIRLESYVTYNEAQQDIAGYLYRTTGKSYGSNVILHKDRVLKEIIYDEKKQGIFDWMDNFLLYGDKITLFFNRTKHLKEFAERYDADVIYGQTDMKKRLDIIHDFNYNNKKVLCCNIKAAGVGLDIIGCHNTGFVDFDYVWENMKQAIKRFDRFGQKSPIVSVYYFAGLNTIEEYATLEKLDKKHETSRRIVDGRKLRHDEKLQNL
jgi:SWI/SNF-related matrix-associated actin-dependent regulator 1 of chromatin subfamily A